MICDAGADQGWAVSTSNPPFHAENGGSTLSSCSLSVHFRCGGLSCSLRIGKSYTRMRYSKSILGRPRTAHDQASCTTKRSSACTRNRHHRRGGRMRNDETEYITSWWLDCSLQDKD